MIDDEASAVPSAEPPPRPIVSLEQFEACTPEAVLTGCNYEAWSLSSDFDRARAAANAAGEPDKQRVFDLLSALCRIALNPADRAKPWGSYFTDLTWRTAIPADFVGDQTAELGKLVPKLSHPVLRARIADIVWSNDRKQIEAAKAAIDGYCATIEKVVRGEFTDPEHPGFPLQAAYKALHRVLQIMQATSKRADRPSRVLRAFDAVYRKSIADKAYVIFVKVAGLGAAYELLTPAEVAPAAEALAAAAPEEDYPEAVRAVWDLAARLHVKLEDEPAKQRCQLGAVHRILAMRRQVGGAGAEAYWVGRALDALHHVDGADELEDELSRDYRRLQKRSLREMASFTLPIDLTSEIEAIKGRAETLDLPAALYDVVLLDRSRPRQELCREAEERSRGLIADMLFGSSHVDGEGKTIAFTPTSSEEDRSEAWYIQAVGRSESIRRHMTVVGAIEPMRRFIAERFDLVEGHFAEIAAYSPFIPDVHEPLFALGMLRFYQGDFMSAAHLLLPLWEPCFRHILKVTGNDPVKRFPDGTEEDMNLGNMFDRLKPALGQILSEPIRDELEWLLVTRPGPTLRHDIAHGQITAGRCFSSDVIYANWLLFRVTCLFILKDWEEVIRPALDSHSIR